MILFHIIFKIFKRVFILFLVSIIFSFGIRAQSNGPMGTDRIARVTPLGYESKEAKSNDVKKWVQVDLGHTQNIDSIKLYPFLAYFDIQPKGFPLHFNLTASNDSSFNKYILIDDYTYTRANYLNPFDAVQVFDGAGVSGRYVRLTATSLRQNVLALSKIEVFSGGADVAQGCPISDLDFGYIGKTPLTRKPRPQGEGVITDNPINVVPENEWKPVSYKAWAPINGVDLGDGIFKTAMENNINYLLNSYSVDQLLLVFRERARQVVTDTLPPQDLFWDISLAGSNAGRFLMGAGNTLRWLYNSELSDRVNKIVNGIAECREPNGYIMAYPENTIFYSERGAYTRSWLTQGLISSGRAGNPLAFQLLRGYYDWFNHSPYLPELLRRAGQGVQGMIASSSMYFTPVGKPKDLQVIQQYFQENYWLDELSKRDPAAIWLYPYDHPHNYLITSLEPYLDLYRATGDQKYLNASIGGWDLYHNNWEHVGGSIAICEYDKYPPKSYYLHQHTGELCGSVFWVQYNQRFHLLYPDQEKYVNEIEKSIYNVGLANQDGSKGIRYHANLVGKKEIGTAKNSCCEGQGTRLYGSLPEYIYSISADGLYVNLFASSSITWKQNGQDMKVHMKTNFPFSPDVQLQVSSAHPVKTKLHIRVPSWASKNMQIKINGKKVATGMPGTFVAIDRTWSNKDIISFTLPVDFKLTPYEGMDEIGSNKNHYALEYGPILMALVGEVDEKGKAKIELSLKDLIGRLQPKANQPLHFSIKGDAGHYYIPYYQVEDKSFTCYPEIGMVVK